jgi:hypothetical protein
MQLVTVFTTFSPTDADLVNARLDAAKFHPAITNSTSALGYSTGLGGILVQVPEDEAEAAREFLAPDVAPPA